MNMLVTAHNKSEWSRLAKNAYSEGINYLGHRYSAAAVQRITAAAAVRAGRDAYRSPSAANAARSWDAYAAWEAAARASCAAYAAYKTERAAAYETDGKD